MLRMKLALCIDLSDIVNVTSSNFIRNNANNGSGTIEMNEGQLFVANSTFVNNTAFTGGAIDTVKTNVTIIHSVFIGNEADYGGAIATNKSVNITYSVFYDNYATTRGDAIYLYYGSISKLTLDYNWWGSNDPFNGENCSYLIYNCVNSSFIPWDNWVVMTLNASADTVYRYTPIKFNVTLNKYFNSTDNSTKLLVDSLPTRTVYFEGDGFNPSQSLINGEASSVYTSPDYYDIFDLGATIDGETLLVSVENVVYETEIIETELLTVVNGTVEVHVIDDVGDDVNIGSLNLFYDNRAIGTSYVRNGAATFNINLPEGNYTVLAFYFPKNPYVEASQYINLTVLSDEFDNRTVLNAYNLTENLGEGKDFTGSFTTIDGAILSDKVITLNLTRLSDNASKLYNVTTDIYGDYYLPINLAVGEYTAQAFFESDGEYESSNSSLASIIVNPKPKDSTVLIAGNFTEYYGAGSNFTGQLLDNVTGEPVIGQHIAINLTCLSNGLSKVYWVTTDTDGEFQLVINLGVGDYTALCGYAGTSRYESCMVNVTISVNPL